MDQVHLHGLNIDSDLALLCIQQKNDENPQHHQHSLPSDVRSCSIVDTFKRHLKTHLCSDSLNLMPPAPLHLWTLWCYTNAVITVLLFLLYIQLYSPHNMVAKANKTSKNTTNEIEKNDNSSTLHI